jgi:hypothetical protein
MFIITLTLPTILDLADMSNAALELSKKNTITADTSNILSLILKLLVLLSSTIILFFALALTYSVSKRNLIIALATRMIQANLKSEDTTQSVEAAAANRDKKNKSSNTENSQCHLSPITFNSQNNLKMSEVEDSDTIYATTIFKNGAVYRAKDGKLFTIKRK